jgi:hypothetical protein
VDVRPRELKVGEPLTVSLRLQGTGNIASALPPAYRDTESYKTYEARQVGDTPDAAADGGAKSFEQVVIPRAESLQELPALQFSFYDPDGRAIPHRLRRPLPDRGPSVRKWRQLPDAADSGRHLRRRQFAGPRQRHHLSEAAPARWRNGAGLSANPPLLIGLHAAAPLALAGLFFATRRRNRLATDIALARRQKAPRSARANLRKAEAALRESAAPAAVFAPLAAAAADYFGHRLNLPPGAVEAPLILAKLRAAQTDEAALAKWQEFFALSDQIRYASSADLSREALAAWIATLTSLLRKAERIRL